MKNQKAIKTIAQKFWDDQKNIEAFRKIESKIRRDIDSQMFGRPVTTEEESITRQVAVGWHIYEIGG